MTNQSVENQTCLARRRRQSGNVLVLATLSMFVLFGFMGLVLDMGYMYFHKRRMQTAADAAAIGGAQELLLSSSVTNATIVSAGRKDSQLNGFTNATTVDGGAITVDINSPPTSGTKAGQSGFVEAIVTQPQPTMFMRMLGFNSATVKARAVAGVVEGLGCIYALDRDTSTQTKYGVSLNGSTQVNMTCGTYSNSNFSAVGGGCLSSNNINYVNSGGYTNSCGVSGLQPSGPVADPMLSLFPTAKTVLQNPNEPGLPTSTSRFTSTDPLCATHPPGTQFQPTDGVAVQPGYYCGGIKITGSYTNNIVFNSGVYVIVGGFSINGGANLVGTGVTFFFTYPGTNTSSYSPMSNNGNGTVTFSAPDLTSAPSSPYLGLLFYQDPSVPGTDDQNKTTVVAGGTGSTYNGIIYFPSTNLEYTGNSTTVANSTAGYTILIGYNVKIAGGSIINSDYTAIGGDPLKVAAFVE
jgi:hypothetical protein